MMDYKEKYEAALGRARKELKTCGDLDCGAARLIFRLFPQLRESEDERIRKEILECIETLVKQPGANPRLCDWIIWLEKQKEQNLGKYAEEDNLAFRLNWVMQDFYNAGRDEEEKEHRFKCYKLFWDALEDSMFFEQKEQKPVNEEAEKEKTDYVSGQFLYCRGSFDEFKEGESYWLEYVGDDTYVGRSDNVLNQKFHITPRQLYTWLIPQHDCGGQKPGEPVDSADASWDAYYQRGLNKGYELGKAEQKPAEDVDGKALLYTADKSYSNRNVLQTGLGRSEGNTILETQQGTDE